ncbi:hypothetical protein MSPP1_001900 [Malassezia sp. CBS 17886]|nr:hypothetical protein MSPP1_001900 [Malassezia sp. CBS 17886]
MDQVSFHGQDAPVGTVLGHVGANPDGIGRLVLSFSELGDAGCRRLLEGLAASSTWRWLDGWQDAAEADEATGLQGRASTPRGIRALDLSSNQLASFVRSGVVSALAYNATLSALELQGNELGSEGAPTRMDDIAAFAHALGTSALRTLNLSANSLGDSGMAHFFDALPRTGTPLKHLYLNVNTHASDWGRAGARGVARFLRDASASRGLTRLHLNGNDFGWDGVRTIVSAVVGTPDAAPNRALCHLDLFSTGFNRPPHLEPPGTDDLPPAHSAVNAHLTRENWAAVLKAQLDANVADAAACRQSALDVLGVARIVACRARDQTSLARGAFPILRLPLELREHVLHHIDTHARLSRTQMLLVLRWASDPSTIGYGRAFATLRQLSHAPSPSPATLAIPPWSWEECFEHRSQPRNWYSDAMDARNEASKPSLDAPEKLAFWECTNTDRGDGGWWGTGAMQWPLETP